MIAIGFVLMFFGKWFGNYALAEFKLGLLQVAQRVIGLGVLIAAIGITMWLWRIMP